MDEVVGRIAASASIVVVSAIVVHAACLRASTIYFFELDAATVVFVSKRHALLFPIVLSLLLSVFYLATKRSKKLADQRKKDAAKAAAAAIDVQSHSSSVSRKVSRSSELRPVFEGGTEDLYLASPKLKRLLSDIEEAQEKERVTAESYMDFPRRSSSAAPGLLPTTVEEKDEDRESKIIAPPESTSRTRTTSSTIEDVSLPAMGEDASSPSSSSSLSSAGGIDAETLAEPEPEPVASALISNSMPPSRRSSVGSRAGLLIRSRRNSVSQPEGLASSSSCELYKELGQVDLLTYLVNAVNVFPAASDDASIVKRKVSIWDLLSDLLAVHAPVWLCVAALYVVLLELITHRAAFYFYYHEETMAYAALFSSILFGLLHEFAGGWASNDVLAFASIYVVVSRIQLVSFQTGCVLAGGLVVFDLFWLYVIDLLSTVTGHSRAPLMVVVPRDNEGGKQSIATLDIMAPGVLLNVLLKFNSMYDPKLYGPSFYAAMGGLAVTMAISIWRNKITPALVLPMLGTIATALAVVDRPNDLWRFMIKH